MKAVAYYRFSSDNQHEESIEQQQQAVRAYAKNNNIEIIKEYIDRAESATTDERPDFKNMAYDIMNNKIKVDLVLVYNTNRFARNRRDAIVYKYDFAEKGTEVISVTQHIGNVPGRTIYEAINEALDEEYSKNLSREVTAKMRTYAQKGRHLGGIPPLGLDIVEIDGIKTYQLNKREQEAANIIIDMLDDDFGYSPIQKVLNEKGFRTKRGKPFGKNSIYEIARNPKIAGIYTYGRTSGGKKMKGRNGHKYNLPENVIELPGALPQVVYDFEKWARVQKKLDERRKVSPRRKGEVDYMLTGKIICSVCGASYVGNSRKKKGVSHYLYCCNNRKRTKQCTNIEIRKEPLEWYVLCELYRMFNLANIDEIIGDYEREYKDKILQAGKEKERAEQQILNIKQKIDRLYEAIENGLKSTETFNRINGLLEEKTKQENILKETESSKGLLSRDEIRNILEQTKKAVSSLNDPASSRWLISHYVQKVILTPEDILVDYKFGADNAGGPEPHLTLSAHISRKELYAIYWGGGAFGIS